MLLKMETVKFQNKDEADLGYHESSIRKIRHCM